MSKDYNNVPDKHIRQYGNPVNKITLVAGKIDEAKNPTCAIRMFSEIMKNQHTDSILAPYFSISKHRAQEKKTIQQKKLDEFLKMPLRDKIRSFFP